jgi:hypothetical protein
MNDDRADGPLAPHRITVRGKTKTEVKDQPRTKHAELAAGIRTPAHKRRPELNVRLPLGYRHPD